MKKCNNVYTKFPNVLLEYLMSADLNAAEMKVVLCIARNTYGNHDVQCEMSVGDIQKATNISKRYLQDMIKSLLSKSILIEIKKATSTTPRCLAINHCYEVEIKRQEKI